MSTPILYIGMDVHAQTIAIAIAEAGGEVRNHGGIVNDLRVLEKTLTKIKKAHPGAELRVCYEAEPTGFVIARRLIHLGIACAVVAPSLIPSRSGDRIKTDSRDAVKLARLHRAGELTAVHVPDAVDEAMRDLCRARTDAVQDLRRARAQLNSLLKNSPHHENPLALAGVISHHGGHGKIPPQRQTDRSGGALGAPAGAGARAGKRIL